MHGETLTRRSLFRTAWLGAVAALAPPSLARAQPAIRWTAAPDTGSSGLPAPDPLVHLVNRITFGALADDRDRARRLGFEGFVEEQLHPEEIEDSEVEAAARARFPTVGLSQAAVERYPRLRVANQLKAATLYRAVASRRQLFEVMVDFWSNHFNVHHLDGPVAYFKTIEDRDLIRRHALGKFRDLLAGSAKSPAMIVYLDNFSNQKGAPNENYARELMELHTLGVDAGFSQDDVEEVARAFTGWKLAKGDSQSIRFDQFRFDPARHDDGARTVLGAAIPAGLGVGHGERVLDLLASHPACARFIAFKLCRRFVADDPSPALIDRAATTFTATDGDIRAVLRTVLLSDEFLAAADRKLKRPFEYLVSALRAVNATLAPEAMPGLLDTLFRLGQLPFDCAPPTGYPDVAEAWGHTNGLLDRWNFALALGSDRLEGVTPDFEALTAGLRRPTPPALADHLIARLIARDLDPEDRRQVIRFVAGSAGVAPTASIPQRRLRNVTGSAISLLLSSPYFQWR